MAALHLVRRQAPLVMKSSPAIQLTEKQRRFATEYALDHNASRAARAAGYGVKSAKVTGCRLLTNVNVQRAVAEIEATSERAIEVSRWKTLLELQAAAEIAKSRGDPMAMIAAWREIGKMCGYYPPNRTAVVIDTRQPSAPNPYESMSDDQLMAIVNEGGR